ncbi:glycosyl transferase [Acidobacteria bacterium AH-259-A15]|nr:glycosyl transferase [Acidobacteria bacterium AH-259-A15]
MSDFHQGGVISTLHRLGTVDVERLEKELLKHVQGCPIALVLPCLYSELEGEAVHTIVEELKKIQYIDQIVLSMDRMDLDEFKHAASFFSQLPQRVRILWHDGPQLQKFVDELEASELSVGEQGKGRGSWLAFGYVLATQRTAIIALHDCDIVSYKRELLVRLCYPVANTNLGYEFCKGYYARYGKRLYGRVTRLFVTPLLRALTQLTGHVPLLDYLESFRYPLAGEFAITTGLARANRIPADWGLEIGTLCEVYRNCSLKRICQVDLIENYQHKHRELSPQDPTKGLMKMAVDIADTVLRTLATEGVIMSEAFFRTLSTAYQRSAEDIIRRYNDDAALNGLELDRHAENLAVGIFRKALEVASRNFLEDPHGALLIPNWNRVVSAIPDFLDRFCEAVEEDNHSVALDREEAVTH